MVARHSFHAYPVLQDIATGTEFRDHLMTVNLHLINDAAHTALFNMAADLYLLDKCVNSGHVYVRLYTWRPSAISLGYMQKAADTLKLDVMHRKAIEWVRRPTGGRAVFHTEDLTYSCIFPKSVTHMGESIAASYAIISNGLQTGLRNAGIKTASHDSVIDARQARREIKLPCFLAPNRDEIMVSGKKLIGSAQKRMAHAVLQHGSIPLTDAFQSLPNYMKISSKEREVHKQLLQRKTISISQVNPHLTEAELRKHLADGFAHTLPFPVISRNFAPQEIQAIRTTVTRPEFAQKWHPQN
ncbi:MAG: hypothetical protein GF398_11360 [Chitinivibrionales bacterium]|nr:hypothetical protein [Chitinivibrionales bacterium]